MENTEKAHVNGIQIQSLPFINNGQSSTILIHHLSLQNRIKQKSENKQPSLSKTGILKSFNTLFKNKNINKAQTNTNGLKQNGTILNQKHSSYKIIEMTNTQNCSYINTIFLFMFLVNCVLEAAKISQEVNKITGQINLALQCFFTLSIVIRFFNQQKQNVIWLIIDITTNICGYLSSILADAQALRYLRAIKILRLLIFIKQSNYLKSTAAKLIYSLSSVGKILFPAVMFIYFYSVIGLFSFRDYQYNRCRDPANKYLSQNWTVYSSQINLCGQKSCPIVQGIQLQCLNPIDYGVQPNISEVKNLKQGSGLMRYSNIFYSLFSTFKQTFITGSSRIMVLGKQAMNYYYVLIFHLSFIYLLAYIYLNIFYGLLMSNQQQCHSDKIQSSFQFQLNNDKSKDKTKRKISQIQQKKQKQQDKKVNKSKRSFSIFFKNSGVSNNQAASASIRSKKQLKRIDLILEQKKDKENFIIQQTLTTKLESNRTQVNQYLIKALQSNNQAAQTAHSQAKNHQQRLKAYKQIMKKYYLINHFIVFACSINILIDYQGQSFTVQLIVDSIDFTFYLVFLAEILFKLIIHRKYLQNQVFLKDNKLEFTLFLLCTIGIFYQIVIAENFTHFIMATDSISKVLRAFKYLRILILISSTPFFIQARIIFNSIIEAIYSIRHFTALWWLILLIFSLMGFHMFQGKVKVDRNGNLDMINGSPRKVAFQGIIDAFTYTIYIFFNEEWDQFMFQQYTNQNAWIVIWQLIVLVIGLQIFSKYFMALLMKQLGDKLNQQQEIFELSHIETILSQKQVRKNTISNSTGQNIFTKFQILQKQIIEQQKQQDKNFISPSSIHQKSQNKEINLNGQINNLQKMKTIKDINQRNQLQIQKQIDQELIKAQILQQKSPQKDRGQSHNEGQNQNDKKQNLLENQKKQNQILQQQEFYSKIKRLLTSKLYLMLRVIIILLSIICTFGTGPNKNPDAQETQIYYKLWIFTVSFFGVELILNIFTFGLFAEKQGYFRSFINWIYFIVLIFQIISLMPNFFEQFHLQALLSLRVLRILVFAQIKYKFDPDMRLTIVGFKRLLPKLANLLGITLIMYGFFATILVKIYKEEFYYCDSYYTLKPIVTVKDCMNWGGNWVQRRMNVSNIWNSLLYLFLVATTQGWSDQVIEASSLSGKDYVPIYGRSLWMQYFFTSFFFFGNMIMLNVFVGLSVNNFQNIKSQVTGLAKLSQNDKTWLSIKNTIYRLRPVMKDAPLNNYISQLMHTFKKSRIYKIINLICLAVFTISMSFYTTNMSSVKSNALQIILYLFIAIFMLEYIISWVTMGLRNIKQSNFIFQTIVIMYFTIFICINSTVYLDKKQNRILHGVAIIFLSIRYFALLYEIQFVKKMINSLISIFPRTANNWLLMFLVLFSYSVIGIYLFTYLKVGSELNDFDQNYTNLPNALYALVKFSTLQSPIQQVLDATAILQPNSVCFEMYTYSDYIKHGRMGCGNRHVSYIFFLSFHLIYVLILLSTLLAVIVDAYSEVRRQEQSMVNKFQLQEVQKQWQNYDPQATGYISYRDFWMFTTKLIKIYKVSNYQLMSNQTRQSFLESMKIPIYQDENGLLSFQFHDVVQGLTKIVVQQKMEQNWNSKQADKVFMHHNHQIHQFKLMRKTIFDSSHVLCLITMKAGLKSWNRKVMNAENHKNLQGLLAFVRKEKEKEQINEKEVINQINTVQQQRKTDKYISYDRKYINQSQKNQQNENIAQYINQNLILMD